MKYNTKVMNFIGKIKGIEIFYFKSKERMDKNQIVEPRADKSLQLRWRKRVGFRVNYELGANLKVEMGGSLKTFY